MRQRRVVTMLAAACAAVLLFGACGNNVPTADEEARQATQHKAAVARQQRLTQQQRLARRGKVVNAKNRVKAQNLAQLKAAIRSRWQERASFGLPVQGRQRVVTRSSVVQVQTGSQGAAYSAVDVCRGIPPRGGGKQQRQMRRALLRQRKSVLYYLNLSCPSS